jgi:hypothetical protein
LSSLTAATGANTIANGNNTGQIWNWANTTDSTIAFSLGETSAATNGTSSSGVPNQVLLKLNTLASSTQSPLSVYSRATHVFSVNPSAAQILANIGSGTSPTYAFANLSGTGMYADAGPNVNVATGGNLRLSIGAQMIWNGLGGASAPVVGNSTNNGTGLYFADSGTSVAFSSANTENARFMSGGVFQPSKGSADAVGYALNVRKARGTVASPTAITSGDDLATLSGYGYVGGTNTYREAARIIFDSTGTISDAANGIGGNIDFSTQKQGTDTTPAVRARIDQNGHLLSIAGTANTPTMGACGTSPSVTGTDNAMLVTVGTGGAATSCAINFGSAYGTAPVCTAQNDTDRVAYSIAATVSAVTVSASAAFTASSKFHIICLGV